jgi:hypothetical protein
MTYNYSAQKAALTRALKTGDPRKVERATIKAIREWGNEWPDDWSRWERALRDVGGTDIFARYNV